MGRRTFEMGDPDSYVGSGPTQTGRAPHIHVRDRWRRIRDRPDPGLGRLQTGARRRHLPFACKDKAGTLRSALDAVVHVGDTRLPLEDPGAL
jgi:hypothetical protein